VRSNKVVSLAEAARLVNDGDVVTVSSSSGLGCPDAMLAAIGARFDAEAHPRNLTMLHPIAAGDMYGIKGVDHIAKKGLISTIVAGSFPSGPSSLPMPDIWQLVTENEIRAYNLPSGVMFDMHREVAAKRPGVITKVGIDTYVDPARQGGAMNALAAAHPIVEKIAFGGEEWLHYQNFVPRVAIVRATTADERGNLSFEHEGALLGGRDQALAVRNNGGIVIAQVKRVVKAGSLHTQQVHIPCNLVDYVVVDPAQMQTTQIEYDPEISGEVKLPDSAFAFADWNADKVIARRAAMELAQNDAVNLGFGISANVPRILIEEGYLDDVTWAIEQGAVGGVPLLGFAFGCSGNADAIMPSPSQFVYFQGGGFDVSLLSFLQVDRNGHVNVSKLPSKPYLTAGCGGFIDITTHAKRLVFSGYFTAGAKLEVGDGRLTILKEGKKKFIADVDHVTFSGRMGRERNQEVLYVTERCVIRLTDAGLELVEIAPGVDLRKDIIEQCEFELTISPSLKVMDAAIFTEDRFGLQLKEARHG
jgi:propionate CoA-transferase